MLQRLIGAGILRVRELVGSPQWTPVSQHSSDGDSREGMKQWATSAASKKRQRLWISFTAVAAVLLFILAYNFRDVRLHRYGSYQYPRHRINLTVTGSDPFFLNPVPGEHLPKIAPYNEPPTDRPKTPLFIAFTRNYKMLEQTVVSFIAAGWPRDDIIVVDNSGTMDANQQGLLTRDVNPFFLDYEKLLRRYGVNILRTPTLLTFSQLQNFFIAQAMARNWPHYYWSHSDVALIADEKVKKSEYKSAYQRALDDLAALVKENEKNPEHWAIRFYRYDWLTLVNTAAMKNVGSWDPFIPYYITDCEFNDRVYLAGMNISDGVIGKIYDLAHQITDLEEVFFPQPGELPEIGQPRYHKLRDSLQAMQNEKYAQKGGRNTWQSEQDGGWGEPWTYNPAGFQRAWWMYADTGKKIYKEKWGISGCGLVKTKLKTLDAWKDLKTEKPDKD